MTHAATRVDYTTLTGTTAVWRDDDANCCPAGGELWIRLRIGTHATDYLGPIAWGAALV